MGNKGLTNKTKQNKTKTKTKKLQEVAEGINRKREKYV
jgi:hypothetical protein